MADEPLGKGTGESEGRRCREGFARQVSTVPIWRIHNVGTRHSTHSTRKFTTQRGCVGNAKLDRGRDGTVFWSTRGGEGGEGGEGRETEARGEMCGKCEAGQGKRQTSLLADNKALANRPAVDDADFAARMDQKPTALSGLQRQLLVQGHALIYGLWRRWRRRRRRDSHTSLP